MKPGQGEVDTICMCKAAGETIDHLFIHCSVARELWSLVFSVFGVWWVLPCHVLELLTCWSVNFKRYKSAAIWELIPHCILWVIWRERNARSFEDSSRTIQELKQFFLYSLFIGLMHQAFFISTLYTNWLTSASSSCN